ncbi:MAG: hypothetical protein JNL74_02275 [Fibrobacteres bacterium]|nr:hypothetical protein [Fibrobacterota bacterium]
MVDDASITIYLAPGAYKNFIHHAGGIKVVFGKDLAVRSNEQLHLGSVPVDLNVKCDISARTSSVTEIINEIDIAQYLIWRKKFYNNLIKTKKYAFFLYYIPDDDTTIKQVFSNKDID